MMNILNTLKSKKGIALENSILFMMIIFSLCFLIATFTLIGHYQKEVEEITLENRVKLDQIGENYVAGEYSEEGTDGNYKYTVEGGALKVYHKSDNSNKNVLLYVTVDEERSITRWCYFDPTN